MEHSKGNLSELKKPTASSSGSSQENHSEDESSGSDIDDEEIMKALQDMRDVLVRYTGQHKNVTRLRSDAMSWQIANDEFFIPAANAEEETHDDMIKRLNEVEDKEQARRMSQPFQGSDLTDLDLEETSEQKTGVHEELLHLFAVHEAKFEVDCEQTRRTMENAKHQMEQELIRRAARKAARDEFEEEKSRRIQEMESIIMGEHPNSQAMAEANDKLNKVHFDLKNAFKLMENTKLVVETSQIQKTEDRKEMLLQEIRRKPAAKEIHDMIEQEQERRVNEGFNLSSQSNDTLVEVQEQLLKLFGKLKKDKKTQKQMTLNEQAEKKARVQEDLVRRVNSKNADQEVSREKSRRIKEAKSEEDNAERTRTVDMLLNVQKQLLDCFVNVNQKTGNRQKMDQVKHINQRQNMLVEIRNRRMERDRKSSKECNRCYHPGRRLSVAGDQLTNRTGVLETIPSKETDTKLHE